ncbi:MAG TPA: hypothetical protein PK949_08995, partial [Dysgonamonadaceae bacterium]|nr:hypothetical protein [Dysgonamonadaceae bacterium]
NAAEYVENMKTLLTNLPLKEKMQSRGVEFASTLNWDHLVNEYFTDLETLATHHYSSYTNEAILPNEIYPTNFAV